jgi:hypothetical protein
MTLNPFFMTCVLAGLAPTLAVLAFYGMRRSPFRSFRAFGVAIAIGLLAVAGLWLFIGRYIPRQRARLFEQSISAIQSIQVDPVQFRSLVDHREVITNEATINDIMLAFRSAKAYSPSHPVPRWGCNLVISDHDGKSYVELINILASSPQGTIVFCKTSERGFIYDTFKSETVGDILEKAIRRKN